MSFRVNVKIPKNLEANVKKAIEDAANDKTLLQEVGEITRKDIIVNMLQGKSAQTGKKFKEPNITDQWRDRKKKLKSTNSPFDNKSAGGSGLARLIFTGKWIESLKTTVVRESGKNKAAINATGTHKPYKNLDGSTSGKSVSNKKLGQYFADQGREWRGATEKTRKALVSFVRRYLRGKIKV